MDLQVPNAQIVTMRLGFPAEKQIRQREAILVRVSTEVVPQITFHPDENVRRRRTVFLHPLSDYAKLCGYESGWSFA
jgi:hypothetical protein